jgi:hypothetical protein
MFVVAQKPKKNQWESYLRAFFSVSRPNLCLIWPFLSQLSVLDIFGKISIQVFDKFFEILMFLLILSPFG